MPDDVEVTERTLPPSEEPVVDAVGVEDVGTGMSSDLLPLQHGVNTHGALHTRPNSDFSGLFDA